MYPSIHQLVIVHLPHIDIDPVAGEIIYTKAALFVWQASPTARVPLVCRCDQNPRHGMIAEPRLRIHHSDITTEGDMILVQLFEETISNLEGKNLK